MKLTNEDKFAASVAMLKGDNFTRGNALMFPLDGPTVVCVMQTVGPADKCQKLITSSWNEAVAMFEEFTEADRC